MEYQYWFSNLKVSQGIKHRLLEEFGNAREIYYGIDKLQEHCLNRERSFYIEEKDFLALKQGKEQWNLGKEWGSFEELGINFVTLEQESYPNRLKYLSDAPYGLYYLGELPKEDLPCVSIVGARGRSAYGSEVAKRLGRLLGEQEIAVISGMARGIDSDAHWGALEGKGKTYAVLGCGVDVCYPAQNRYLYDKILEQGGIISEYPPGTQPLPRYFPVRNRIISGLSSAVVVIEAREKSGSLITADYAMEQGKDVYALPGPITASLSCGCNRLISQGAGILWSLEEFVKTLSKGEQSDSISLSFRKNLLEKEELLVYSLLDFCPTGIGTLAEKTSIPLGSLLLLLESLVQKGFIKEEVPNFFTRTL